MRYLTGSKIAFGVTGLLIVLAVAGWFLFGSDLVKVQTGAGVTPGSTVENGCQAVYRKIMAEGWGAMRIEAEPGFRVEKALYITGREAKATYNANFNVQDNSHICYVLVRGNIDVGSPFTSTVHTITTGYAFYDPDSLLAFEYGGGEHY